MTTLIYCADGNQRFAEIALAAGFRYGAQLPNTIYAPLYFADQDWRNPDRERYMQALTTHRPTIATVLDYEQPEQRDEVLSWAAEAAQFVDQVVIVPKATGTIEDLPRQINGARVVLGYSVPTKYAGTQVPLWEFKGWPVHLLGGSPQKQMELATYLHVTSADGNMAMKMATQYCAFWTDKSIPGYGRKKGYFPPLKVVEPTQHDAPYRAFELSCQNIVEAWSQRP